MMKRIRKLSAINSYITIVSPQTVSCDMTVNEKARTAGFLSIG